MLEYGQRLGLRQRNVAAAPQQGMPSTAAHLFNRSLSGGAAAAGIARWGLQSGARADLAVLDMSAPGLLGLANSHVLDGLVFACDGHAMAETWVAGQRLTAAKADQPQRDIAQRYQHVMAELRQVA